VGSFPYTNCIVEPFLFETQHPMSWERRFDIRYDNCNYLEFLNTSLLPRKTETQKTLNMDLNNDTTIYSIEFRPISRHPFHPSFLHRLSLLLDHHHDRPSAAVTVVECSLLGRRQVVQRVHWHVDRKLRLSPSAFS